MTLAIVRNRADSISQELRNRLVGQLIREHAGMTGDEAVRVVNATVAFLTVCAENPGTAFRPSRRVDLGWHMFILNTHDYAEFCDHLGAGFLHHVPDEFVSPATARTAVRATLTPTVEALTAAGLRGGPGTVGDRRGRLLAVSRRVHQLWSGATAGSAAGAKDVNDDPS